MKPRHAYDIRDIILSGRGEDMVAKKREITASEKIKEAFGATGTHSYPLPPSW